MAIRKAGFPLAEAIAQGYVGSVSQAKAAGYIEGLKAAGYSCQEAKQAGYSCEEARQAGYSCHSAKRRSRRATRLLNAAKLDGQNLSYVQLDGRYPRGAGGGRAQAHEMGCVL